MVGRPRKSGKREPNGRLQRAYVNPRAQVASQPHRNGIPERFREWAEAGTHFGRLMLTGHLTPAQFAAGEQYAERYKEFQKAINAPGHDPKAMDYNPRIAGKSDGIPDEAARRAQRRFTEAYNAIEMVPWQIAVMRHAVHDQPVATESDRKSLSCGLAKLVDFLGIDERLQIIRSQ